MKVAIHVLGFFLLISCVKEKDNKFNDYFRLNLNGKKETLERCEGFLTGGSGGGQFSCEIIGDTVLFVNVGCYAKAGFYIKGMIKNGTYDLNEKNGAWYRDINAKTYRTTAGYKGTLTIEKGTFQSAGQIQTLKGEFSFTAIDTASGQTLSITKGEFLMERYHY